MRNASLVLGCGLLATAGAMGLHALALRQLKGKVLLITGGSRGLGLVIARLALSLGAKVAFCSRTKSQLNSAEAELSSRYGAENVLGHSCDVSDEQGVRQLLQAVAERFGRLDLLINNAGVIQVGPAQQMKRDDYNTALDTHFWGPFNLVAAALPLLEASRGRIVNVSSIGGKVSVPHLLPYSVSKFALAGFSEGLAAELRPRGVSVTTVFPGLMRTGSARNAWFTGQKSKEYAWFSIGSALPLVAISAEAAARKILIAAMRRRATLVFPWSAKLLTLAHDLAPGTLTQSLRVVNYLLPDAAAGNLRKSRGKHHQSAWSPSLLTVLADRAAERNNEVS